MTKTIELEIQADVAEIYDSATDQDKEKLQALFGVWLKEFDLGDTSSLKSTMNKISANAQKNGLTSEILDSLLAE